MYVDEREDGEEREVGGTEEGVGDMGGNWSTAEDLDCCESGDRDEREEGGDNSSLKHMISFNFFLQSVPQIRKLAKPTRIADPTADFFGAPAFAFFTGLALDPTAGRQMAA